MRGYERNRTILSHYTPKFYLNRFPIPLFFAHMHFTLFFFFFFTRGRCFSTAMCGSHGGFGPALNVFLPVTFLLRGKMHYVTMLRIQIPAEVLTSTPRT